MIKQTYSIKLITPCFCAGADQSKAEIRAASIRGQLRWWFRILGGFKSMAHVPLRDQESIIFGSASGNEGNAGSLITRTSTLRSDIAKQSEDFSDDSFDGIGYLVFPLRKDPRGVIESGSFSLSLVWKAIKDRKIAQKHRLDNIDISQGIRALASVVIHLGSIGFRSRRGFGCFAPESANILPFENLFSEFNSPKAISVFQLEKSFNESMACVKELGNWLKSWRAHGRSKDHPGAHPKSGKPPYNPGFNFAKIDHDIGYGIAQKGQASYRPSLGLPIIQRCGNKKNNWEYSNRHDDHGRFASPVILRPYCQNHTFIPLVIFIDKHCWQENDPVYLNGQRKKVSLDLYESMKNDPRLVKIF